VVESLSTRVAGRLGDAEVDLAPFPMLACPLGHERKFLHPDFALDYVEHARAALPMAGPALVGPRCSRCLRPIDPAAAGPVVLSLALQLADDVNVRLDATMPLVSCGFCGLNQAVPGAQAVSDFVGAVARALEAISTRP
jgi:hypothetical protein